jgi:hypothetical protein
MHARHANLRKDSPRGEAGSRRSRGSLPPCRGQSRSAFPIPTRPSSVLSPEIILEISEEHRDSLAGNEPRAAE